MLLVLLLEIVALDQGQRSGERIEAGPVGRPVPMPGFAADVVENGPDLELYLVPGERSYSPGGGSLHLGPLKGNVGNQTYEIPRDFTVASGPWTVLVWCEAFSVEFVGASLTVT